ncbi:MAG: hypothetical protein FWE25_03395 [Lachnospiraceae bacterium]|nr:hypothetical protein [Lachnospiraceae bacterium]
MKIIDILDAKAQGISISLAQKELLAEILEDLELEPNSEVYAIWKITEFDGLKIAYIYDYIFRDLPDWHSNEPELVVEHEENLRILKTAWRATIVTISELYASIQKQNDII